MRENRRALYHDERARTGSRVALAAGRGRRPLFAAALAVVSMVVAGPLRASNAWAQVTYQELHRFATPDRDPYAGLVQGSDGAFYGTTKSGGALGLGTVFKMDTSGTVTRLHSFSGATDGASPQASLVQGSDGAFYGTALFGGASNAGTVFKMDASGTMTLLHSFTGGASDGANPSAGLVQGTDGAFYGTTSNGGASNLGTAFKMDSIGTVTLLHAFAGATDGANVSGILVQGSDGAFYGTTSVGGASNLGTVFKMDTSGTVTRLHSFIGTAADGASPSAGLVQGSDGAFYGATYSGGASNLGTVFKMDTSGAVTLLHSFTGTAIDGANPHYGLALGCDGAFYGTTYKGGASNVGTVFKVDTTGTVTLLHSFGGTAIDGGLPAAGLVQGSDGAFYGTTEGGGPSGGGTAFKIDTSGTVTLLHAFGSNDGASPRGLVQGSDGAFYGTTYVGGYGSGAVFKMDTSGAVTLLHAFVGTAIDGAYPYAGLVQGSDGTFYGTTYLGGASSSGTVFKIDASGVETLLHSFVGTPTDGEYPLAGLVQGSDGAFYGATYSGGASGFGTVFKMDTSGAVTLLHSFACTDGCNPLAGLVQGSDGAFYGTTVNGGTSSGSGYGTVFKMDTGGTVTTLHAFAFTDGASPYGGLVQGTDGAFYGTTGGGGASDFGTVFRVDTSGTAALLHEFTGTPTDGAYPFAGLVQGSDGAFYGTTSGGGASDSGTVFKMDTSGTVTLLHEFTGTDGASPRAGLVQGRDGAFYGTAYGPGAGLIFRLGASLSTSVAVTAAAGPFDGTALLSATLTSSDSGAPLRNQLVAFSLYGTPVGSALTDTFGVATLAAASLVGIPAGTYPTGVSASFDGTVGYLPSGGTATLVVTPVTTTGTLVVHKDTLGADGTFYFIGDGGLGVFSITTTTNAGSKTFSNVTPGTYHVSEFVALGWTKTGSDCSSVTVTAGGTSTCTVVNSKNPKLGEIRGTKYEDRDGDGKLIDGDHHRLWGWTIYLDTNNNGRLDSGEPSTVTDFFGDYRFKNLPAGSYHVREVQKSGWIQTYPASGKYDITLTAGQAAMGKSFGNFKLGAVFGMKFWDKDGDGRQDNGEPGLANWTIALTKPNGATVTMKTDATGKYSFAGLGPGVYVVREVQQSGWQQTTRNPANIWIRSGTQSGGNDFGNRKPR
jgi:uncharacterized repeat protein (TIGR03803 family)